MKRVQFVGGTTVQENGRIGLARELTMDTDTWSLRLHDGVTPGGVIIPNESMISGFNFRRFTATATYSIPGVLPDTIQQKLGKFSVAGTYSLPLLADILQVGTPMFLQATTSGVIIDTQGSDAIYESNNSIGSLALTEGEIVELVKMSTAAYVVLNRY